MQVHVIGRRGAIQAAFTTKEFREILELNDVETYLNNLLALLVIYFDNNK